MSKKMKKKTATATPYEPLMEPHEIHRPELAITGTATRPQRPERGKVTTTITCTASTPEAAWDDFQKRLTMLRASLDGVARLGNVIPTETSAEVQKLLRTVTEVTVKADVVVKFEPASFGEVIKALVSNRLRFSQPKFVFENETNVTPDLLGAAAADARRQAEAIAASLGCVIGSIKSICIGKPQTMTTRRPLWHPETWGLLQAVAPTMPDLHAEDFEIDTNEVETSAAVVTMTVTFEFIPKQWEIAA